MKFNRNALLFVVLLMVVGNSQAHTLEQEYYINNLKMTVQELYDNADAYYKMSVAPIEQQLNAMPPDVSKEQLDAMIAQRDKYIDEQENLTAEFSKIRPTINSYLSTLLSSRCDPQAVEALKGYSDPLSSDQLDLLSQYERYSLDLKAPLEVLKSELERNGWAKLDENSAALQQFDKVWDNAPYILYIAKGSGDGISFLNDIVKKVILLRMRGFANSKTDVEQMILNLTPSTSQTTNPAQHIELINRGTAMSQRLVEFKNLIGKLDGQLSAISNTNEQFNELGQQRYDVVENWYDMREELDSVLLDACKYCLSQPCDTIGAYTWLRGEVEPMLEMVYHKSYKARRDSYLTLMADYDRYSIEIGSFLNSVKIYTKAGQVTDDTKKDIISLLQSLDYYKNYYVKSKEPKEVSSPYLDGIISEFEQMWDDNFSGGDEEFKSLFEKIRGDVLYYSSLNRDEIIRKKIDTSRESLLKSKGKVKVNGASFKMIPVDGGTFTMGEGQDAHKVTLSSYFIGQTEVTQGLWKSVMGNNPSYYYFYDGSSCPVECVSWEDCQEFIKKLNQITGMYFRVPTEAEWEFAARGGNKSRGYIYSGGNEIDNVCWYNDNSGCHHFMCFMKCPNNEAIHMNLYGGDHSRQVKKKNPNELELFDMSGNVWEWCQDWYDDNYYHNSPSLNPIGASSGTLRVIRGGGWDSESSNCRVFSRSYSEPGRSHKSLGFRLAL